MLRPRYSQLAVCLALSAAIAASQSNPGNDPRFDPYGRTGPPPPGNGPGWNGRSGAPGGPGIHDSQFPGRADNISVYDQHPSPPWPKTQLERQQQALHLESWLPSRERTEPGVVSVEQLRHPVSDDDRDRLDEARKNFQEGRWDAAMEIMNALADKPSVAGYAKAMVGEEYLRQGDIERAVFELREAADILPGSAAAHSNLAYALAASGQMDEAEAAARQALALKPAAPKAEYILGVILLNEPALHYESRQLLHSAQESVRVAHLALAVLNSIDGYTAAMREQLNQFDSERATELEAWTRAAAALDKPAQAFGLDLPMGTE